MTKQRSEEPLDLEQVIGQRKEKDRLVNIRFMLELIPIALLSLGIFMRYKQMLYWEYALLIGGILSAGVYLIFSRFLLKAEKQKTYEVVLSVASGIVIPLGILGVVFQTQYWDKAETMMLYSLYGCLGLVFMTILSFLYRIKNQKAARFHRSLLARLMIFSVILYSMLV